CPCRSRYPDPARWRRSLRAVLYLSRAHRRRRRDPARAYVELHELFVGQRGDARDLAIAGSRLVVGGVPRERTATHADRDVVGANLEITEVLRWRSQLVLGRARRRSKHGVVGARRRDAMTFARGVEV